MSTSSSVTASELAWQASNTIERSAPLSTGGEAIRDLIAATTGHLGTGIASSSNDGSGRLIITTPCTISDALPLLQETSEQSNCRPTPQVAG